MSPQQGGAGLPHIADLVDIHLVNYAFKKLASEDHEVKHMASVNPIDLFVYYPRSEIF